MATWPPLDVNVWGEWACFTRPEMKAERVSYPVMTPSAARGVLEAIFWKPEFTWVVREIWVLNPVRYHPIQRNEVSTRQSYQAARGWATSGAGGYSAPDDRTQRHTLALRDVAYLIRAEQHLRPDVTDDPAKFRDQFRRRVARGQCYSMPYLGCREFSASFGPPDGSERPLDLSDSLGTLLHGIEYDAGRSGAGQPRFFEARLERGILHVPPFPPAIGAT
jgi:CRISPR-associated protein Cas5d